MEELNKQPEKKSVTPDEIINKIQSNDFKIYFYCPPINQPSGGIEVIFRYAQTLIEKGFNVNVIYEPIEDKKTSYIESQKHKKAISVYEKFNPIWLGDLTKGVNLKAICDKKIKFNDNSEAETNILTVNPEDFLIIPEGFPNIMQNTINVPCKRIVLAQSWYYILNGLEIGQKWQHFNIQDVMSISEGIVEYLNAVMPGLKIKKCPQSIDRNLFKNRKKISEKAPMVVFMGGRSQESQIKAINIIKTFYAFFPQYRWIRFHELRNLSKEEFAERLDTAAIALFTDEIAGFGTLPLEAIACGTHVVGWTPLGGKEYMSERNGFWTTNGDIFKIAEILGFAIDKFLTSQLDNPKVEEEYEKTLSKYTIESEKEQLSNLMNEYKNERIEEIKTFIKK